MTHLSLESLARLLDEEPSGSESEHLAECSHCRSELDALRADRDALGALPDLLPPPPTAWSELAERLKAEGLIHGEVTGAPATSPRTGGRRLLYLAASLALFLFGGGTGYLIGAYDGARPGTGGAVAHDDGERQTTSPGSSATGGGRAWRGDELATAESALQEAEAAYVAALLHYDELALGTSTPDAHLSRLAELLEEMTATGDTGRIGSGSPRESAGREPLRGARRARHIAGADVVALDPGLARYFAGATTGVLVLHVEPGTTAAKSGLEAGDVVTVAAGREVGTAAALWSALSTAPDGGASLTVIRRGARVELQWRP